MKRMRPMLGTYVEIEVEEINGQKANRAIEEAFKAVAEVDQLLSSHRSESELNLINAAAGKHAIQVSRWTYQCIESAIHISELSDGAFDITCRPVLDLWGFVHKKYHFPSAKALDAALDKVNFRKIQLLKNLPSKSFGTEPVYRVGLGEAGMKLDVGAIGKGFAVDKAVEALQGCGIANGLVRAGGDIRGFGSTQWKIGIANPLSPGKPIFELNIQNEAVSTSGSYQNYFVHRGKRYSHVIDPRTGWPVESRHSLSVRAPTCTQSDGWSTALFVNPKINLPHSIEIIDMR